MSLIALLPLILAGVGLGVAWHHFLIRHWDSLQPGHREFSLLTLIFSAYALACAGLYLSRDPGLSFRFQQARFILLALSLPAYLRFALSFLAEPRGRTEVLLFRLMLLIVLLAVLNPAGILLDPARPHPGVLRFPGLQSAPFLEFAPGLLADGIILAILCQVFYILRIGIIHSRRGERRARSLVLAVTVVAAAGVNDALVLAWDLPLYLLEYAYFALIMLMSHSLAAAVADAGRVRRELRRSEEKYREWFDNLPDAVFIHDAQDGRILEVNKRFEEMYGFPRERIGEWTPEMGSSGAPGFTAADVAERYRRAAAEGAQQFDWQARRADGSVFWVEVQLTPVSTADGPRIIAAARPVERRKAQEEELRLYREKLESMVAARTRDLEELLRRLGEEARQRERAVEALSRSEARYRHLIENLKDDYFFYVHDTAGVFTYVSPSVKNVLGYSQEEYYRHYADTLTDDPINADVWERTAQSILGIRQPAYEVDVRHRDGGSRRLEVTETPIFDAAGQVQAVEGIARDITRELRAREALRQSEQRFRSVVEAASVGMHLWRLEPGNRLILEGYNPEAERIIGRDHGPLLGQELFQAFPDLGRTLLPEQFLRICRDGGSYSERDYPFQNDRLTGVFEIRAFQTQPGRMVVMFHDVTERHRAERKLEARRAMESFVADLTRRFLRPLGGELAEQIDFTLQQCARQLDGCRSLFLRVDASGMVCLGQWSVDGRRVDDSQLGFLPGTWEWFRQQAETAGIFRVQPGEEERVPLSMRAHLQTITAGPLLAVPLPEGNDAWILLGVERDPDGRPFSEEEAHLLRMVATVLLTARQRERFLADLQESEQKFHAVFENAGGAILLADAESGRILDANGEAERLLGRSRLELVGMHQIDLHPVEEQERYREIFRTHVRQDDSGEADGEIIDAQGRRIPVWIHARPLELAGRRVIVGLFLDMTERRAAEQALLEAHGDLSSQAAELQQANEDLQQYAYVVSHDLKAPLRAIHNYASFLQEDLGGELPGETGVYLDNLFKAVQQGEKLVADLLHYSRLDGMALDPQAIDLNEFLREILEVLPRSREAELLVPVDPPKLWLDRVLLFQLLLNLLDNALKFTRRPRPRVELRCWQLDTGEICLEVEDDGIGIDERYREQIFGIFERLHPRGEFSGTGIGLAIVRKAVRRLGGRIQVGDGRDGGTCFRVTLPGKNSGDEKDV